MPLYEMQDEQIVAVATTTFANAGLKERSDLQRLLRDHVDVISPETLVLSEEFGDWSDGNRRIDLLGLDREGSLVVIELKRTDDGGHMDLQALRYAAMVSTMTFEQAVETYRRYLSKRGKPADDAESTMLAHMSTASGADFNNAIRIVLASANFSMEITTSVMWLNNQGLDIRCVRLQPYRLGDSLLLDVQQVIPLPEATDYQVAVQHQTTERREVARGSRDFTRYSLRTSSCSFERLPKRHFIFQVVKEAIALGLHPDAIAEAVNWRGHMFVAAQGNLTSTEFSTFVRGYKGDRYFCQEDELFKVGGMTFAMSNQWGLRTEEAVKAVLALLPPGHNIVYRAID